MDETSLAEDLAARLEPPDEDAPPPMDPLDEDRANRMLFKLRRLARDRGQVQSVARAERDRVDAWERDRLAVLDTDMGGLTATLEAWMRMHAERTKAVTKKLPNGELRLRPGRPRLDVTDDSAALAWTLVRIQQAIDAALAASGTEAPLTGASAFRLVWGAITAEPMVRAKLEVAKDAVKKAAEEGPISSEHEDLEMRKALIDGEAVPGLLFEKDKRKAFGMTLATVAGPDESEEDDGYGID